MQVMANVNDNDNVAAFYLQVYMTFAVISHKFLYELVIWITYLPHIL